MHPSLPQTHTYTPSMQLKYPTIPCKKCKQCNKTNNAKFLHIFKVSFFQAVLMAVPVFHLYNTEAKGRSPRALNYSFIFFRRCFQIRKTRDLPESNFNLLLRLVASKTVTFRTLFSIFPTLANILRWFTQSYKQCASSNINKTFV